MPKGLQSFKILFFICLTASQLGRQSIFNVVHAKESFYTLISNSSFSFYKADGRSADSKSFQTGSDAPTTSKGETLRQAKGRLCKYLKSLDVSTERIIPTADDIALVSKVTLNGTVTMLAVLGVDDVQQTVTASLYTQLYWYDDSLTWNESQYGGARIVTLPIDSIWTPDIFVANAVDLKDVISHAKYVYVGRGVASVFFAFVVQTLCPMDFRSFPFDEQVCTIMLYSPFHFDWQLQEHVDSSQIVSNIRMSSEWEVLNFTVKNFRENGDGYANVDLTLRRRTTFYAVCLIMPMVLTSYMNTLVFLLPLESGEKVSFLVTLFVSTSVYTSFFSDVMPRGLDRVPNLMKLFIGVSMESLLILVATLYVLQRRSQEQRAAQIVDKENKKAERKPGSVQVDRVKGDSGKVSLCCARYSRAYQVHDHLTSASGQGHEGEGIENAHRCQRGDKLTAEWLDRVFFVVAVFSNTLFLSVLLLCSSL